MKTIKNQVKAIALILSILIFFQCCTVYKSKNVSLEQASKADIKTKVTTTKGEQLKFKRIGVENEKYYGIKLVKGEQVKVPLDNNHIENINLKDRAMSTILSVALPIAIIVGAALIFQDSFKWKDSGEPLFPPGTF